MGSSRYFSFLIILIWGDYKLSSFQRQDLILLSLSFPTCFGLSDFTGFNTGRESLDVFSEVTLKSKHLSCFLVGSMHTESDWLCSIKTLMFLWEEKEKMSGLPRPGHGKGDAFGLRHLLGRILIPAAHLRRLGWVSMQAGWFTPTLISLNEVRWEICAMCRFGKLSVTNAAATLPPSHMFPLFPVLKKQIVCRAKLLNLIASSTASQLRRSLVLQMPAGCCWSWWCRMEP